MPDEFIWVERTQRWRLKLGSRKPAGVCKAEECLRLLPKDKKHGSTYCRKCAEKIIRKNNSVWAKWCDLRWRARGRRKHFAVTYPQWVEFYKTRPTEEGDWTVDRINPLLGYVDGNLQWLTREENSRKGATTDKTNHRKSKIPWDTPMQEEDDEIRF